MTTLETQKQVHDVLSVLQMMWPEAKGIMVFVETKEGHVGYFGTAEKPNAATAVRRWARSATLRMGRRV